MSSRLKLGSVLIALAGLSLVACGDDSGKSEDPSAAAGSTAGRSGASATAGRGFGGRGASGRGGGAGRGMTGQMCPMTEPAAGETCVAARGNCMFGTRVCDCITPANTWACWDPSQCPTSLPPEQSSCPVVGMTCSPSRGNDCTCRDNGWDCDRQFCPAAEPASGSQCETAPGSCTYGSRTCDCARSAWACWNPADCPAPPPADNAACTIPGMACMYEGGTCSCGSMSTWTCGRGVMNDSDAGI